MTGQTSDRAEHGGFLEAGAFWAGTNPFSMSRAQIGCRLLQAGAARDAAEEEIQRLEWAGEDTAAAREAWTAADLREQDLLSAIAWHQKYPGESRLASLRNERRHARPRQRRLVVRQRRSRGRPARRRVARAHAPPGDDDSGSDDPAAGDQAADESDDELDPYEAAEALRTLREEPGEAGDQLASIWRPR